MVIDCFPILNELDILEIRLNTHTFVDTFIITEASTDFAGNPKPLYLRDNFDRFKKFHSKIWYRNIDLSGISGTLQKEIEQRNYPLKRFGNFVPNWTIISTDVDEIIKPEAFERYNISQGVVNPELDLYAYYLNTKTGGKWRHGVIGPVSMIKDLHTMRYKTGLGRLPAAGWHFSWCGGAEFIQAKYMSQRGGENWPDYLNDKAKAEQLRDELKTWWNGKKLQVVPETELPEYVQQNKEALKHLIYDK